MLLLNWKEEIGFNVFLNFEIVTKEPCPIHHLVIEEKMDCHKVIKML